MEKAISLSQVQTEIVDIEWEMFHTTENIGGQASCQQNRAQFEIMRSSQFLGWDSESMKLYLEDLKKAQAEGENLITLKYAYMMESTDPEGYAHIADRLPPVSDEKKALVEALVAITVAWCEDFAARYPHVAASGRVIRSSSDSLWNTSVETYSRGENSSYSVETLKALLRHYESMKNEGVNLHERIVESEMRLMGIESLAEAEAILSRR